MSRPTGKQPDELAARVLALAGDAAGAAGIKVLLAEPGRVHLGVSRRDDLLQFKGYFHGGVISGLADLAGGGAVATMLPAGHGVVTISLNINFLAPARGERLVARGTVIKVGGTIGVASVEVLAERGGIEEVTATGTVTYRVVAGS
ncbi:MAG: PaaI family thioesterase [Gammaproteobacteria bacterium]